MAQLAVIEQGTPLYELALHIDLSKVPEKLRCKSCEKFLINGFKTACCDGSICENCNLVAAGGQCPLCKHTPFLSNPAKAARGTARSYLKNNLANAEPVKSIEPSPIVPLTEAITAVAEVEPAVDVKSSEETPMASVSQISEYALDTTELDQDSGDVVQSIEQQPRITSRRPTIDSASGNEPDDDIEINVGTEYDVTNRPQIDAARKSPVDEDQRYYEKPRKNSTMQPKQESYGEDSYSYNNMSNFDQMQMPPEAQANQFAQFLAGGGMNPQQLTMPSNPNDMIQMQIMMQNQMQQMSMLGMPIPPTMMMPMMNMNGPNANWQNNMGFPNMMNNQFMNNSGSYSQYPNFPNGDSRPYSKHGNFQARGRGRKGGRGGRGNFYQQQYQQDQWFGNGNGSYNFNGNMMPPQNQHDQNNMHFPQNQFNNRSQEESTNADKDYEQTADDDDFAPGGQEEIREALGDSYEKKPTPLPEEPEVEEQFAENVQEEEVIEQQVVLEREQSPETLVPTPKAEVREEDIPEAYREDLDTVTAPLSAPLGPSAKDVPFRSRGGHGRFPSRGRGSFHGINGYPPHSPARTLSQTYTHSPPANHGPGVVGAPTGPRAMREKDLPPSKPAARSESDGGFKIRGQASVARPKEEVRRSPTPRSAYDDDDGRDTRDAPRRYSKYDRKYESSSRHYDQPDEYDADRDRKRRKSRREDEYDDHDMQDADPSYSHARSDSQDYDRGTSHRNGRKEKEREKTKDKYSSTTSKHKSSSRKHEYEDSYDEYDSTQVPEESNSRSTRPSKKPSKYDDRDDRKERDHERAERDKHRKRSRHDREREEGYEDDDEEESRRRSRKHKKEHTSSSGRKDRDRERDRDKDRDRERDHEDPDLGMRISGRSASHRTSGVVTPSEPATDKDPHTLEREARNRERMLKEQQRRENAAKAGGSTLSGGRTRSFKYEDDIERSLAKPSRRR